MGQEILQFVRDYADKAHGTQLRKYTGERYIGHPVRVVQILRPYFSDATILAAALLHDVLEDTPITAPDMKRMLDNIMNEDDASRTLSLVVELTDIFVKKDYPRLNRQDRKEKEALRLSKVSSDAQSIKYADIIDNVTDIMGQDTDFAPVFVREAKRILIAMKDGHPELRNRAMNIVDTFLDEINRGGSLTKAS